MKEEIEAPCGGKTATETAMAERPVRFSVNQRHDELTKFFCKFVVMQETLAGRMDVSVLNEREVFDRYRRDPAFSTIVQAGVAGIVSLLRDMGFDLSKEEVR